MAAMLCLAVAALGIFGAAGEARAGLEYGGFISTALNPVDSLFAFATEALFTASRVFIGLCIFALRMFMEVAAYNGYIDAPPVVVGWYMIRDIANMFFVVALLIIAFGTILGLEQYEWKKALVKLVLAAILINFSRLIIGVFVDASHIATVTFLNAAQGAAGGNLIEMLKLGQIMEMTKYTAQNTIEVKEGIRWDLFAAGLMAMLFSLIALVAIGAYLVVMIARVVMLWILIILSPLAFVLSAIPQAKTYAEEFWKEVSKYILVAPIMMFFLWLAFATLGSGDINNHVGIGASDDEQRAVYASLDLAGANQTISLSKATTWENMSAFLIAIGFLFAGLDRVSKLGVVGGGLVSGALNFGKRALEVAAGVTLARYVGAKGKHGLGMAVGWGAKKFPVIGGEALDRKWKKLSGIARIGKAKLDIGRQALGEKAAKWAEEKAGGPETRGGKAARLGVEVLRSTILAPFLNSAARENKKAEDWQNSADIIENRRHEEASTSKTMSGKSKTKQAMRLEIITEEKAAAKARKFAERKEKELSGRGSRLWPTKFKDSRQAMLESQARAENIKKAMDREKAFDLSKQRAAEYVRNGQPDRAAAVIQSALAAQFEEDMKEDAALDYKQRVNNAQRMSKDLHDGTYTTIDKTTGKEKTESLTDDKREEMQKAMVRILAVAAKNGMEEFGTILNNSLMAIHGKKVDITTDNPSVRILESILGKEMGPQGFRDMKEGQNSFNALYHSKEESQAVLSSFGGALKILSRSGGDKFVGAVLAQGVADENNDVANAARYAAAPGSSTGYRFAGAYGVAGDKDVDGSDMQQQKAQQDYWATRVDTKTMVDLDGYADTTAEKNPTIQRFSPAAKQQLLSIFSTFSDARDVASSFNKSFVVNLNAQYAKGGPGNRFESQAMNDIEEMIKGLYAAYGSGADKDRLKIYQTLMNSQFGDIYKALKNSGKVI